jgi:hypothetical protein
MVLEAEQSDNVEEDSRRLPDPLRTSFISNLPDTPRHSKSSSVIPDKALQAALLQ